MHAVGRASKNAPTFINLRYNGNPDSDKWLAYVGKGVCFDSGGLNIKPSKLYIIFSFRNKRYAFG
jgi:leucyl aminopeptidase